MDITGDNFQISVDVTGNGVALDLDVITGMNEYFVSLDGIQLTRIRMSLDGDPHWEQLDGNIPQNVINALGEAIEGHKE